ncbi:hypothetical protein JCM10213_000723 [Rhodosporidiobolus nylandii]
MGKESFKMSVWAPELRSERTTMFKILGMYFVLMTVAVWALLSVFWGSTYKLEYYFPNIKVYIYDFDSVGSSSPLLGPTVQASLLATVGQRPYLTFIGRDTAGKTLDMVAHEVIEEKAWAAVVINANATTSWQAAMDGTGGLLNGEWSPQGAISIMISGARWFQVTLEYLNPYLQQFVQSPVLQASHQAAASYLSSATPATLGALSSTQQAALASPFAFQTIDLRPIHDDQWAGAAPLEAGLIYYIIFSFHITLFLFFARIPFQGAMKKKGIKLTWLNVCLLRIVPCWIAYFFLSLWYSLINKAFLLPTDGNGYADFGPQGGFMIYWMLNWLTLASLGLAMESMLTLLTLKFLPLFLITWILLNITSSFFPATLAEHFYKYGYAMPFYHATTATKHILWGARDRLALNFGVLAAWALLSMVTLSLFELMWRRKQEREARQASSGADEESGSSGSGDGADDREGESEGHARPHEKTPRIVQRKVQGPVRDQEGSVVGAPRGQ